jgi:3-hydroxyisobutyrate dehydrogenase
MCANLSRGGFEVSAYDIDTDALGRARDAGANAAESAADCARGMEALITMLPAPPQVEQVLLGAGGVIEALDPGALAIEMSTSSTAVGQRILRAASARGISVLDAPVAGHPTRAREGALGIYVGGAESDFKRARPLLESMGDSDRIFHLGPHGAGYTVKLLLNLLWFIQSVATGEVLTVGVRAGVPLDRLHAALVASPANTNFLERDVLAVLESGDYDEVFPLRLVTKDLGLALDLARDVGVPVELTALVEQVHRRARAKYGDDGGQISAIRLYEDLAGIKLRMGPPA